MESGWHPLFCIASVNQLYEVLHYCWQDWHDCRISRSACNAPVQEVRGAWFYPIQSPGFFLSIPLDLEWWAGCYSFGCDKPRYNVQHALDNDNTNSKTQKLSNQNLIITHQNANSEIIPAHATITITSKKYRTKLRQDKGTKKRLTYK